MREMNRVCLSERSVCSRNVLRSVLRKSHIFQHFLLISFPSLTCTYSREKKQKAIYAAQYQILLSWRGPSPWEAVSAWEGVDACKSASNTGQTEQSTFFLIRKETKYKTPFRIFSVVFFFFFLKYCITLTKFYLSIICISDDAIHL